MHTTKDLANLLKLMQTSRQSGDLVIEPSVQDDIPWQGRFRLADGQVTFCQICHKVSNQVLLSNAEAFQWLLNTPQGKLQWNLEESARSSQAFLPISGASTTQPGVHAEDSSRYNQNTGAQNNWLNRAPRHTGRGEGIVANSIASRDHRQVFALIDGKRTIIVIAQLLHKPLDIIIHLLNDLKAAGLIE